MLMTERRESSVWVTLDCQHPKPHALGTKIAAAKSTNVVVDAFIVQS
jgi:hypothetical protein